jgi:hypothetical protein
MRKIYHLCYTNGDFRRKLEHLYIKNIAGVGGIQAEVDVKKLRVLIEELQFIEILVKKFSSATNYDELLVKYLGVLDKSFEEVKNMQDSELS